MKAKLILENGMVFGGRAFGYLQEAVGEVVFTTGMTGYQEILTDPSYHGQIVSMTYPLIGNYGLNLEDIESCKPEVKGFIVKEACDYPNNFRCEFRLEDYLRNNKIMAVEQVDTRALTKVLRTHGTMKGIITTEEVSEDYIREKLQGYSNKAAVMDVTARSKYTIPGKGMHIGVMDFGIKSNILRSFAQRGCALTVFPAATSYTEVLRENPDMIFLSNGPGDPCDLTGIIDNLRHLIGRKPITGICLGHQLLALALGGRTAKLKFGHRGCNHPVKDIEENKVYITSQNHGYYVEELPADTTATHISMNDGTIEGMRHNELPIYSVQFHPEASPGPRDINSLFDRFMAVKAG
ncbi:MAG TPA: carbamoyl phosphate synthase small subunit [Clostridia bacterium]|nr:carbamoyl phosphate synthase small subunit [Clostridia bacterium]